MKRHQRRTAPAADPASPKDRRLSGSGPRLSPRLPPGSADRRVQERLIVGPRDHHGTATDSRMRFERWALPVPSAGSFQCCCHGQLGGALDDPVAPSACQLPARKQTHIFEESGLPGQGDCQRFVLPTECRRVKLSAPSTPPAPTRTRGCGLRQQSAASARRYKLRASAQRVSAEIVVHAGLDRGEHLSGQGLPGGR
jgi:hypothetical protein